MKKISLRDASSNQDITAQLLHHKLFEVSEPAIPDHEGDNQENIDSVAQSLQIPTPATLDRVIAELDRENYVEVEVTQKDGTVHRYFLSPEAVNEMPDLDEYLR